MYQGWRRSPLLAIFLLLWKNTDGFTHGTYPDANHWWGHPSDNTFSSHAVQSSMPETPMTGILPEEVDSGLLSKRPLESRSKFNLRQFVKGSVSSSSESTSNAHMAPSAPVSSVVSLPIDQLYVGSLSSPQGSSVSSNTGAVGDLVASPFHGSFGPELSASSKQLFSTQVGSDSYSDVSQSLSALSQYNPESSMNNKIGALSLMASIQPISDQSLPSVSLSNTQSRSDTQSATGPLISSLGGSSASGPLPQSQPASCQSTLGYSKHISSPQVISSHLTSASSSVHYPSVSLNLPQGVASQPSAVQNSRKQITFTGDTGMHMGSSGPLSFQESTYGGSLQPQEIASTYSSSSLPQDVGSQSDYPTYSEPTQGTKSQLALGYRLSSSVSLFSPQAFKGNSGTSPGSSAPLVFQGNTGFGQLHKTQDASRLSFLYTSPKMPQDVTSQYRAGQSTSKRFTSDYGTQVGSSAPFTLQEGPTYSAPLHAQSTRSHLALGYPLSSSASLYSPQGIASQSSTVHDIRKQFTLKGSSDTSGSSAPLAFQGGTGFVQLPKTQDASSSSSPYTSVSLPQDVTSQFTTGQSTRKGYTSNYNTQAGSSTAITYSRPLQAQDTKSQLTLGYPQSSSVSLYSPQGVARQTSDVHGSRQLTQTGSSARIIIKGSTDYAGCPLAPGSLSYPSAFPQGFVSKPFSSGHGTLTESSARLNLHGGATYGGSLQHQDTANRFARGSRHPSKSLHHVFHSKATTERSSSKHHRPLQAQATTSQLALGYPSSSSTLLAPESLHPSKSLRHGFHSKATTERSSSKYHRPLQAQVTTSQLALGYPSSSSTLLAPESLHPSKSLHHGFHSKATTEQSSSKHHGPLQAQVTTSQLALGYPSSSSTFLAPESLHPSKSLHYGFHSKATTERRSSKHHGPLQAEITTSPLALGYPSSSSTLLSSPQDNASQSSTLHGSRKQFTYTGSSGTPAGSFVPFDLQETTGYGQSPKPQDAFRYSPSVSLPQDVTSQSTTIQSSKKHFTSGYGTHAGSSTPFTWQKGTVYGGSHQPQHATNPLAPGSLSYHSVSLPQGFVSKQFTSGHETQTGSSALLTLQGSVTYGESPQHLEAAIHFTPGSPSYQSASLPQGFRRKPTTAQRLKEFTSGYGTQEGSSAPLTLQKGTACAGSFQTQDTTSQFAPDTHSNALLPKGVGSHPATEQGSRKQYTSSYGTKTGSFAPFTLHGSTSFGGSPQPQDAKSHFSLCASASFPQDVASHSKKFQNSNKQFTLTGGSDTHVEPSALFNVHGSAIYGSPQAQVTTSRFAHGSPSYPSVSLSSPQSVAFHRKQNIQTVGVAPSQDNSMGGLSSGVSEQSASATFIGHGSSSLQSPGHSTKYSTRLPSHTNPGSSIACVSSQCTDDQSSAGLSRQERPGTQLEASSFYLTVQDRASSTDGSAVQRVASQFAPGLSAQDAKVPASSQYSEAIPSGSSPFLTQLIQKWQPASSR